MGVALTEDETWDLVDRSLTGIVTTLDRGGYPLSLPVWFVVLDRLIYFRTPATSKKVARIARDGRAGFLVESGEVWAELTAVSFRATAELVTDEPLCARVMAARAEKYRGRGTGVRGTDARGTDARGTAVRGTGVRGTDGRGALPEATVRHYAGASAVIRLTPVGAPITWDNSKIRRTP